MFNSVFFCNWSVVAMEVDKPRFPLDNNILAVQHKPPYPPRSFRKSLNAPLVNTIGSVGVVNGTRAFARRCGHCVETLAHLRTPERCRVLPGKCGQRRPRFRGPAGVLYFSAVHWPQGPRSTGSMERQMAVVAFRRASRALGVGARSSDRKNANSATRANMPGPAMIRIPRPRNPKNWVQTKEGGV